MVFLPSLFLLSIDYSPYMQWLAEKAWDFLSEPTAPFYDLYILSVEYHPMPPWRTFGITVSGASSLVLFPGITLQFYPYFIPVIQDYPLILSGSVAYPFVLDLALKSYTKGSGLKCFSWGITQLIPLEEDIYTLAGIFYSGMVGTISFKEPIHVAASKQTGELQLVPDSTYQDNPGKYTSLKKYEKLTFSRYDYYIQLGLYNTIGRNPFTVSMLYGLLTKKIIFRISVRGGFFSGGITFLPEGFFVLAPYFNMNIMF